MTTAARTLSSDFRHSGNVATRLPELGLTGEMSFGDLKVPVRYFLYESADPYLGVSSRRPGVFHRGADALRIYVHRSVPKTVREVVLFHELAEAELSVQHGIDGRVAHRIARALEDRYAKAHLTATDYDEYKAWRATLRDRSKSLREIIDTIGHVEEPDARIEQPSVRISLNGVLKFEHKWMGVCDSEPECVRQTQVMLRLVESALWSTGGYGATQRGDYSQRLDMHIYEEPRADLFKDLRLDLERAQKKFF